MNGNFLSLPEQSSRVISPGPGKKPRSSIRHSPAAKIKNKSSIGVSPISGLTQDRYDALLKEFKTIDKDKNNILDFNEIYEFLSEKQGSPFDVGLCEEIFSSMDRDKNNIVTVDEFLWSYVDAEEVLQKKIKESRKLINENFKKMEEYKKKLIQARASQKLNRNNIMVGSVLTVNLIEAKDLVPMDSNGLSDPYAILECEGQKAVSRCIPETLNPVWDEEFSFNIESGNSELKVVVMDKDNLTPDEFEGQVIIPLSSLRDQKKNDVYYPLASTENSRNHGKIRLCLQWIWDKTRYLEDLVQQWKDVIAEDQHELEELENQLSKLKQPFMHLEVDTAWEMNEEKPNDFKEKNSKLDFLQNFDSITEKKYFVYFTSRAVSIPVVVVYILTSIIVMYSRPDFLNVIFTQLSLALTAAACVLKKYSVEKSRTLAYIVAASQFYDFFWFCIFSGWKNRSSAEYWGLVLSYANFITKFGVFLSLYKNS